MALINQNSIIGVTSITSPSASNVLTFHTNDTTERLRVTPSGVSFSGTNASLDTSGNLTIAGVLTYEDVTSVDSVGIITAQSGIKVLSGGANITGIVTASAGFQFGSTPSYFYGTGTDSVFLRVGDGPYAEFIDAGSNILELGNASGALALTSSGTEKVRITSSGNVGIGTDNPALRAHIYSTAATDAALIESNQNHATLRFKSAVNSSGPTIGIDGGGGLQFDQKDTSKYISFAIGSNGEKLRITSAGKLEVKGTRAGVLQASDDDTLQLYTASTNNNIDRGAGITFYNHDNSGYEMGGTIQVAKENGTADNVAAYMRFSTRPAGGSATERLRINSSGYVGINETNPSAQLHVNGAGLFENGIRGPVEYTGSYTANSNRDITGFGYGNFIVNIRSTGVYHWNGVLMVTMYDTADFGVQTLVSGNYSTTLTASMVNLSAGNGTLRLVFNRDMGTLTVSVIQMA